MKVLQSKQNIQIIGTTHSASAKQSLVDEMYQWLILKEVIF